jgi:hypothetical protein
MIILENQGPNFIKQGILADSKIISILQQISSRGGLIERLIKN